MKNIQSIKMELQVPCTGSAVRYTVYCDQILEGSNKQDGLAVLSMLEAFLKQLSVELPHIRTVTLQSDNAGCYQAKELLLLIAILNTSSQIRIVRFIILKHRMVKA